jgi:hypothetical protein
MKMWRHEHRNVFVQCSEETLRAEMLPLRHVVDRTNAEKVLALEVGKSVTFGSGAKFTRIEDDSAAISARMCGGRSRARRKCSYRRTASSSMCGDDAPRLCDFPTPGGGTCDAPRCVAHSRHVSDDGEGVDHCIEHPAQQQGEQRSFL